MTYVGIDIGNKGALACLDDTPGSAPFGLSRMPLIQTGKTQEPDVVAIHDNLPANSIVVIENASFHQPSSAAMRSQALGFGKIIGMLEIKRIPYRVVAAQTWQKKLFGKIPSGETKKAALGLVRKLWPEETFVFPRCKVPDEGAIDASLLAYYAVRERL